MIILIEESGLGGKGNTMIEAVNSVVANAPLVRGNTDQVSVVRAETPVADSAEVVVNIPKAPYISPYIFLDVNFDKAVLQIRDSDTGDVVRQFPSESTLEARRRVELQRSVQPVSQNDDAFEDAPDVSASARTSGSGIPGRLSAFTVDVNPDTGGSSSLVANAQIAAAALATGARAGQASSTVSVTA